MMLVYYSLIYLFIDWLIRNLLYYIMLLLYMYSYKILHHTLKKESQLKYLHLLRQVLIYRGRPLGAIDGIMAVIYDTSRVRAKELEILFDEPYVPRITLRDAPQSAIGDSIQNDVEKSSLHELVLSPFLFPFVSKTTSSSSSSDLKSENWIVRFIFIQAQATRMVVALSASLIKFETNQVRKNWLTKLSAEYETIRETLIEYNSMQLSSCS